MILSFDLFPWQTITNVENTVEYSFHRNVEFPARQMTVKKITHKTATLQKINSFFFRRKARWFFTSPQPFFRLIFLRICNRCIFAPYGRIPYLVPLPRVLHRLFSHLRPIVYDKKIYVSITSLFFALTHQLCLPRLLRPSLPFKQINLILSSFATSFYRPINPHVRSRIQGFYTDKTTPTTDSGVGNAAGPAVRC